MRIFGGILILIGGAIAIVGGGYGGIFYLATDAMAKGVGGPYDLEMRLIFSLFFIIPFLLGCFIAFLGFLAFRPSGTK